MGIAIGRDDRVVIAGITGRTGRAAAGRMRADGTPLVGGVVPGRGGQFVEGVPVFDTVLEARERVGATACFISVPAAGALDAGLEAIDGGLRTVVIYTENVAQQDALRLRDYALRRGALLLGPNSAGCVTPGAANLSDLDGRNLRPGRIGIVSKSGTLTYELVDRLVSAGEGLSTVVCLGGDPVVGTDHATVLDLFEQDPETEIVVLLGEIGGRSELRAAARVDRMRTPVVAYIAGHHAPVGKRMGHAGALLASSEEDAPTKSQAFRDAGAVVVTRIVDIADAVLGRLTVAASGDGHPA